MSNSETIIAHGVRVEGDFVGNGSIVIDGELTGSVQTTESLHIGETAKINAEITARTAVIAGEIKGNMRITERLELLESCRVNGDINAQVISMAPGAVVNGRITMTGDTDMASVNLEEDEE